MSASGDMHRLVNLASLADSLEYLADAIQHFGDSQQPRQSAQVRSSWLDKHLHQHVLSSYHVTGTAVARSVHCRELQQSVDVIRF